VFDGARGGYREGDPPDALDLYGRSKAVGEIGYGRHLTLRTSIIGFELGGHLGLLSWFFRQPPGPKLKGFTGAIYSGLPTVTLSRVIHDAITTNEGLCGLFHVASEPIDKYDLLMRVNRAFGLGHQLEADPTLQIDRSLDDTRYRTATGTARPGWDALVDDLKADFASWPYDDIYRALRESRRAGSLS
jgi:dTDP-4-dehydrorhamnose reductase